MIKSEIIKINKPKILENCYIESELMKTHRNIVRWAITDIAETDIILNVSYIV